METNEDAINAMLKWESAHRREDGEFEQPTRGFRAPAGLSAESGVMLWLPSTLSMSRTTFDDEGNARHESTPVTKNARVIAKLAAVRHASRYAGHSQIIVKHHALLEFAAALIVANYKFTGAEIGELLSGSGWHAAIVDAVAGGEEEIDSWNQLADMQVAEDLGATDAGGGIDFVSEGTVPPANEPQRGLSLFRRVISGLRGLL